VNSGGTVSPGSPIGTLKVTGSYVQGTSGKLVADVTSAAGDRLDAGTADLGGTLELHRAQPKALARKAHILVHARSIGHPFTVVAGLGSLGGNWKVTTAGGAIVLKPA
jgi:hypothetical protein